MMKIQILLYDGFDELDAIAPFEVLQMASTHKVDLQVALVTLGEAREVIAQHGLTLRSSGLLQIENPPDLLIVPGGGWIARAEQGAWKECQKGEVPAAIARLYEVGATIASVCTGAMLLAHAGLLTDRVAITHHQAIEALEATGAEIVQARVVDDDRIITAGGITSGIDLALWILERYFGVQVAQGIEQALEYERRGAVWKRLKT